MSVNTCAFVGTNPKDEPITSGLPVTRQQTKIRCWEHGDTVRFRAAMNLEAHQRAVVSDYRQFPVPTHLPDYFLGFWPQAFGRAAEYLHRLLPDAWVDTVFINLDRPVLVGP